MGKERVKKRIGWKHSLATAITRVTLGTGVTLWDNPPTTHSPGCLAFPWADVHLNPPFLISHLSTREKNYLRYVLNQPPLHRSKLILSLVGWRSRYQRKALYSSRSQYRLRHRREAERNLNLFETMAHGLQQSQFLICPLPATPLRVVHQINQTRTIPWQ